MKVLITGGQGFIGSHTVARLLERGHEPLVYDRRKPRLAGVDYFLGDVRDLNGITEAMAHADGWIHLAGVLGTQETIENPLPSAETNVIGGLNVLEAASQYDLPGVNIAVGNYWMNNTYSITKNAVERFVAMYAHERRLRAANVRAFNAYGPGQSVAAPYGDSKVRKIVPAFVCRALAGDPIEIYGDGSQVMDMVYVDDVAEVLVDVLETLASPPDEALPFPAGFTLEAGPGRETTVLEIARLARDLVAEEIGREAEIVSLPMRPGEPEGSVVVASQPYVVDAGYVTLEAGLAKTVAWFVDEWLPTWKG